MIPIDRAEIVKEIIMTSKIVIYEAGKSGDIIEVHLDQEHNTVWLTQSQMADLFKTTPQNITIHLKNIFGEGELEEKATCKDFLQVRKEGLREVTRNVAHYNLDAIISVGYRVNSKQGVRFRQWATKTLNEHLTMGYTINRHRLESNARELQSALSLVRRIASSGELSAKTGRGLVDIVAKYAQTFLLLQQYDEGLLADPMGHSGGVVPTLAEVRENVGRLRADLIEKGLPHVGSLFGLERGEGLSAIMGSLQQTVFGEPAYPTIESKAAHLLYFVIKNHPFADGNKRIGSYLFVDFLNRNDRLVRQDGEPVVNDTGLTALALLVAESKPQEKELLVRLVMHMVDLEKSLSLDMGVSAKMGR